MIADELFTVTLPREMRNPDVSYALRITIISSSNKTEPGIAFEAIGVADCTEDMTEELDGGNFAAIAFNENEKVTCFSEASGNT